jgi:hypothetical protein
MHVSGYVSIENKDNLVFALQASSRIFGMFRNREQLHTAASSGAALVALVYLTSRTEEMQARAERTVLPETDH